MALRKPLVLVSGSVKELPSGDTIEGSSAGTGFTKNAVINGGMQVAQSSALTLGSSAPAANAGYGAVDMFQCWATGTAVSAGTATQDTAASIGSNATALKLAGVTVTGTGVVYVRHRIESLNSKRFKNKTASLSLRVYHDVGSSINYTLIVRKANTADTFSAVTTIQTGSATGVASATATQLKLEGISMGDCSTGIEIEVQAACGAVTTKNFWVADVQLEEGATATTFEPVDYGFDLMRCQRYYEKVDTGSTVGVAYSSSAGYCGITFEVTKRVAPTVSFSGTFYNNSGAGYNSGTSVNRASITGFEGFFSGGTTAAGIALEVYYSYTAAARL